MVFMKRTIVTTTIVIIMFVFTSCSNSKNNEMKEEVVKQNVNYVTFGKKVFGIEIGHVTADKVIKILKMKGIKYNIKYDEDFPKVPIIETTYFIGTGIPVEAIQEVTYYFNPFSGKNDKPDITITIKNNYFEVMVNKLIKQFGEPTEKGEQNLRVDNKTIKDIYYIWRSSKESEGTLDFISLSKYLDDDSECYILLRPKDIGCHEVH
mgnify:CR=1 FL=1